MKVTINKSIANGSIIAQPSKSYAHRLLIAAALSKEESVVKNVVLSNDILATINCLKALGKDITIKENENNKNTLVIKDNKNFNIDKVDKIEFDCLESGSTLRFFIPIALLLNKKVIFKGTKKLISRGIQVYEEICDKQGINVIKQEDSITFVGKLKADNFELVGNISSQFITGLLFALPLLEEDSCINIITNLESKNYIDITIDVLKNAGITIEVKDENHYYIVGSQKYQSINISVEGDYSNASFIESLNYLDGNVKIEGLNKNSYQGDKAYIELFEKLSNGYCECDIKNCIDLGPILFAFASLNHGGCFTGVNRLRIKESDRIKDIKEELEKFNIEVTEFENENKVVINNKNINKPKDILYGKNDHRIVMALSIMLTKFGGIIDGVEAVNKSYPNFFDDLKSLGIEVEYE